VVLPSLPPSYCLVSSKFLTHSSLPPSFPPSLPPCLPPSLQGQLNLETFIAEKLASAPDKEAFARGTLSFVHKHAGQARARAAVASSEVPPVLLSVESLVSLLKVLGQEQGLRQGGTQVGMEVKQALELYSKRFPELGGGGVPAAATAAAATAGGGAGGGTGGGTGGGGGSDAIEELANAYFQKIYTSEQSIAEVIEMLKRFKNSKDGKELEIFACMIRNLFDEYRFFHKYPEKVSKPSLPPSPPSLTSSPLLL